MLYLTWMASFSLARGSYWSPLFAPSIALSILIDEVKPSLWLVSIEKRNDEICAERSETHCLLHAVGELKQLLHFSSSLSTSYDDATKIVYYHHHPVRLVSVLLSSIDAFTFAANSIGVEWKQKGISRSACWRYISMYILSLFSSKESQQQQQWHRQARVESLARCVFQRWSYIVWVTKNKNTATRKTTRGVGCIRGCLYLHTAFFLILPSLNLISSR